MNKENLFKTRRLVGLAVLTALVVFLQLAGNFIPSFANGYALALVPIAVGAILYGPLAGLFLGFVMAAIISTQPANYSLMANGLDVVKLLVIMFSKSILAGFVSGLVYKAIAGIAKKSENKAKKNTLFAISIVAASFVVPVINTGIYVVGMLALFSSNWGIEGGFVLGSLYEAMNYNNSITLLLFGFVGINFFVELGIAAVTAPALVLLIKVITRNYNLGFANDFSAFIDEDVLLEADEDLETEEIKA